MFITYERSLARMCSFIVTLYLPLAFSPGPRTPNLWQERRNYKRVCPETTIRINLLEDTSVICLQQKGITEHLLRMPILTNINAMWKKNGKRREKRRNEPTWADEELRNRKEILSNIFRDEM